MIHCIGDSHACIFSGSEAQQPAWPELANDSLEQFRSYRIGPATAYNLKNKTDIIDDIISQKVDTENDSVVFCFGEVDCRAHLIKQSRIQQKETRLLIEECVKRYFEVIKEYKEKGINICVWGPIASWGDENPYVFYEARTIEALEKEDVSYGTNIERNAVTSYFNKFLKLLCETQDITFITFFPYMLNQDGTTNVFYTETDSGIHLNRNAIEPIYALFDQKGLL